MGGNCGSKVNRQLTESSTGALILKSILARRDSKIFQQEFLESRTWINFASLRWMEVRREIATSVAILILLLSIRREVISRSNWCIRLYIAVISDARLVDVDE